MKNVKEITLFMLDENSYHELSNRGKNSEKERFYKEVVEPSENGIFRIKYPVAVKGWYSQDADLIQGAAEWIAKQESKPEPKPKASKKAAKAQESKDFNVFDLVADKGGPAQALEYLQALKKPSDKQKSAILLLNAMI